MSNLREKIKLQTTQIAGLRRYLPVWHWLRTYSHKDIVGDLLAGFIVAVGMLLFIWRSSKPHVAVVGRLGEGEIYRNVLRHEVQCWPEV